MQDDMEKEYSTKKPKKKGKKWVRVTLITLCVLLSLILVAICAFWLYLNHVLDQIDYVTDDGPTISSDEALHIQTEGLESIDPDEELPDINDLPLETQPVEPIVPGDQEPVGDIINILLIGQDRREDQGNERCRSDSMILMTFNRSNGTITMTSFMRDSYVQIPGFDPYKLNAAYAYGGMSLLNETLYANYGVEVHGDVVVDFSQFEDLIDMLGGVEITLTKAEADFMNRKYGWSLTKGTHRLDGEEALAYSRIRYIDNDYKRAGRQRKVLMSLIDQYKSLSAMEMLDKLDDILGLVSTNMDKSEVISLATDLFPMLSTAKFETQQIPAEGTFKGGNVQVRPGLKDWFQYDIDFAANREILREIFDAD